MVMNFLKLVFTWWNGKTLGTIIDTWRNGVFVGQDSFGNKFYTNKSEKKRWTIYKNFSEASKIDPAWHSWIRYTVDKPPSQHTRRHEWQKDYKENMTGLSNSYTPKANHAQSGNKKIKLTSDYTSWKP
jgi:NADH:ubiquinone oxidoreductase subunit